MIAPDVHVFGGQIHTLHTLHKSRGFWRVENPYLLPLPLTPTPTPTLQKPRGFGLPLSLTTADLHRPLQTSTDLHSEDQRMEVCGGL